MNDANARRYLLAFDFKTLFREALGWDALTESLPVDVEGQSFVLQGIAHKRGMVALCLASPGAIPPHALRRKIERQVARAHREHLIVYVDGALRQQVWQWVRQEPGKPLASRECDFRVGQPGDLLLQKLAASAFRLDEEEGLTLPEVIGRVRAGFDVERVTKRFYEQFKRERDAFERFLKGVPDAGMARWYVSVMLNRLMFIYFLEKKGFLNGDTDYLRTKLFESRFRGKDLYYRDFLCPLFFQGFALPAGQRPAEAQALLGNVPYLNGGIFQRHEVEERCGQAIEVPDAAFERLFAFFEQYQWHLDDRPLRRDNEINPDVLGYIFEKYVNQKQMGAYYTQEDITGYISRNTVIPFLFDAARKHCRRGFEPEGAVWRLLRDDPDRYFYPAMKHGFQEAGGALVPLPPDIAAGIADVSRRSRWNTHTDDRFALPTEIWRETVARRQHYVEVREKLASGQVHDVNDLITYNLDIQQFAQDVIETCSDPDLLRAFWKAILSLSALDPTVGSGAFLFAVLNVLEPLYEACLERMEAFRDDVGPEASPRRYGDFRQVLAQVERHPNRKYYVFKTIIVNNLYGVDIMAEAVEIARLRLFLKLVAQVESAGKVEPLPDIDFNIQVGNTLVGFATREQVQAALRNEQRGNGVQQARLVSAADEAQLRHIEEQAEDVDRLYHRFREMQTAHDLSVYGQDLAETKAELRRRLRALNDELNGALAGQYGIDVDQPAAYARWLASHQPFHWFVEFYGIMQAGGFSVIVGNPPYVEYRLVGKDYQVQPLHYDSEPVANLYAFCMERSCALLLGLKGRFGMIVPMGVLGLDKALSLRRLLLGKFSLTYCSTYGIRPSKLFDGVDQRLCIYLGQSGHGPDPQIWTTRHHFWNVEGRASLLPTLAYQRSFMHHRLGRIPQAGSLPALSILGKLEGRKAKTIATFYSEGHQKAGLLHYHRSPRYWIRAMDFEQYFRSPTSSRSVHHFRDLHFSRQVDAKVMGSILNSSLFYFWFMALGNGRNITGTDVELFPVGDISCTLTNDLPPVFDRLMADYRANSFVRTRSDCEYDEFRPGLSKRIIDDIDLIMGRHFGLTDEEVDFIINYDIKYRMGDELTDNEAEEE